jgi:aminopeptidase-like protein
MNINVQTYANQEIGDKIYELTKKLYPICRSITGDGVRKTLDVLSEYVNIEKHEVSSGEKVYDWIVPEEWNLNDAYVENSQGERVIDFAKHSLHVMSYSIPIDDNLTLAELESHLYSLPEQPNLIPYRTSYYNHDWAFCLSHNDRTLLKNDTYKVKIDSSIKKGSLTYGEVFIPGRSNEEILISTHICHPSLANDNLSGIGVATYLAQAIKQICTSLEYGVRIIFIPSTIGAITWLAKNTEKQKQIIAGLVLSGVGDSGSFTYKKSKSECGLFDKIIPTLLKLNQSSHEIRSFTPYGYDERQFCSPGINLPVGCLMRTPFGEYPEYHTSADNLDLIQAEKLGDTFALVYEALLLAQHTRKYQNLQPYCEPQLGRRGLYDAIGGDNDKKKSQMALLWMLSYSDGNNTTLDISQHSGINIAELVLAAERLVEAGLLKPLQLKTINH